MRTTSVPPVHRLCTACALTSIAAARRGSLRLTPACLGASAGRRRAEDLRRSVPRVGLRHPRDQYASAHTSSTRDVAIDARCERVEVASATSQASSSQAQSATQATTPPPATPPTPPLVTPPTPPTPPPRGSQAQAAVRVAERAAEELVRHRLKVLAVRVQQMHILRSAADGFSPPWLGLDGGTDT